MKKFLLTLSFFTLPMMMGQAFGMEDGQIISDENNHNRQFIVNCPDNQGNIDQDRQPSGHTTPIVSAEQKKAFEEKVISGISLPSQFLFYMKDYVSTTNPTLTFHAVGYTTDPSFSPNGVKKDVVFKDFNVTRNYSAEAPKSCSCITIEDLLAKVYVAFAPMQAKAYRNNHTNFGVTIHSFTYTFDNSHRQQQKEKKEKDTSNHASFSFENYAAGKYPYFFKIEKEGNQPVIKDHYS